MTSLPEQVALQTHNSDEKRGCGCGFYELNDKGRHDSPQQIFKLTEIAETKRQ